MKKYLLLSFLVLFLVLFIYPLLAQSIITDRPDQTESAIAVEKGKLQLEAGLGFNYTLKNQVTERQILSPTSLFRYGIVKGLELRLVNQLETITINNRTVQGISDLEIGAKVELLADSEQNIEIAFMSHFILPTGSSNLTSEKFGVINKLALAHELSENIGIGYNLGYNYFGTGSGDLVYSFSLGISLNDKVAIYVEPYGDLVEFKTWEANFDSGFTYLVNDYFQLDWSFGTGINNVMNYIAIGFSWKTK